ncbi:hypothetical protein R77567_03686 [Ralstonia sp. LMG 32965]|uniref:Uncharacterized protein n=1 Tax=Ralstonia flatus TaxID=3058601 RepID=A0AAD2C039_9RALS|nr:hypothetical protein R77567_03686 [Ralstonia sp. LMG 32965]CAJ0901194.1 hypothetical protein R77564_04541 [Ralstonia sp. LMG 32965]
MGFCNRTTLPRDRDRLLSKFALPSLCSRNSEPIGLCKQSRIRESRTYHLYRPRLAGLMQTRTLGPVNVRDTKQIEQSFEEGKE